MTAIYETLQSLRAPQTLNTGDTPLHRLGAFGDISFKAQPLRWSCPKRCQNFMMFHVQYIVYVSIKLLPRGGTKLDWKQNGEQGLGALTTVQISQYVNA